MEGIKRWRDTRHATSGDSARRAELGKRMLAEVRGHRLAEARKRRGMTQAQVASMMDVSPGRVSQIERGLIIDLGTEVIARYVAALDGRLELVADFGDERLVIG